jgi:hypothetical protein
MKKNVLRQPRMYEAKPDFRTPTGGSGYIMRAHLTKGGKLSRTAGGGI